MPSPEELVHGYFSSLPHPLAQSVTVGDYPVAAKLATILKFGQGSANPQEAANFWREFQQMNTTLVAQNKLPIGPEEFTHLAKQLSQSSFAYHGRPPSMYEITKLRDAHPKDVTEYYASLPDKHYPTVPAGEMAKTLHAARPWAQMINGSTPTKLDAAYLYHSGQNPREFYMARQQHDGNQDSAGSNAGGAGQAPAGGQQDDQRAGDSGVASGPAAPGR